MRLVIAEDSVPLREGMARLLEEQGFEVAGQAGDGDELVRKVMAHKPDTASRSAAAAARSRPASTFAAGAG